MIASKSAANPARLSEKLDRSRHLPALALRQRSADHPMAMFAVIVGAAFASMAMASSSGIAASSERTPVNMAGELSATDSVTRTSEAERLCEGQAWGGETAECLLAIVKENGEIRDIRLVASAQPLASAPNVF